jgi:ferritin-like metal-binding protein YciE
LKLIQYLNEAYGKEKQLETALQAHIAMTTRAPYKKRLQQHLRETKGHARDVERRIKQLGGKAEAANLPGPDAASEAASKVVGAAQRAAALAQGPLHALRGTGEQEKLLKNAKTEYQDEAEEIATYTAIATFAEAVGDKDTAKIAKAIIRDEERMASFLAKLIPQLTKAVVTAEVPASERRAASGRGRGSRSASSRSRSSSRSSGSSRSSSSRSGGSSSSRSRSATSRSASRSSGSSSRSSGSSSRSRGSSRRRSSS